MAEGPRGLLLLSMGAPRNPKEVLPFLEGLFGDPMVVDIPLPDFLRRWITRSMARRRAPKALKRYEILGGGSPLAASVEALIPKVENRLREAGESWHVTAAFRYLSPTIEEGLETLMAKGCRDIVLCPLHPHRGRPTTGSILEEALRISSMERFNGIQLFRSLPFFDCPEYLEMVEAGIRSFLEEGEGEAEANENGKSPMRRKRRGSEDCPVVFVAHSVPRKLEASGDPYVGEIRKTFEELQRRFPDRNMRLAWQGQVGPMKWVGPSLETCFDNLQSEGVKRASLAPLSFFFDHVETLVELDLEAVDEAKELGIALGPRFPLFGSTSALIELIVTASRSKTRPLRSEGQPVKESLR